MKNKSFILIFSIITAFLLMFPNNYKAFTAWKSQAECDSLGGKTTKGPVDVYETYQMVCKGSKGAFKTLSATGQCPAGTTYLGSEKRRKYVESADTIDYRNYKMVDSDIYCCEYGNSCKVVDGKYYGASGSVVSRDQYLKECTKQPEPVPEEPPKEECIIPDKEVTKSCSVKDTQSNLECGGEIKETELCGVIAGTNSDDYKSFGNDYCDIYCRREMKLAFEDKVKVIAGRYFKHNISKSQIQNLSAVITVKYECGGQIKYNTWKKDWKEANEELITAWNEYSYWNTIVTLAPLKKETKTYTCSSCEVQECEVWVPCSSTDEECSDDAKRIIFYSDGGPFQQKDLTSYTSKPTSSTKAICENNCEFTEGSCNNPSSTISYSSLAKHSYSCGCPNGYFCSFQDGADPTPKLTAAANRYKAAVEKIKNLEKQIKDCNDESLFFDGAVIGRNVAACGGDGTTTGGYDENSIFAKGYEVNIADQQGGSSSITKTCNESTKWGEFCGSCDSEFQGGGCQVETLVKYECTGTPGQGECKNVTITVPKNGSIAAKYEDESYHYQSASHYTQIFTGNVSNSQIDSSYIPMEPNTWPVAAEREPGTYEICYDVLVDDPKNRIDGGNAICDYIVVNELNIYDCNDGYHECYECPDGEECYTCPDGENCETGPGDYDYSFGVYFRSVNLDDLFPNSKFSKYSVPITSERKIGYNWKNSKDVVDAIQSIDNIWTPDHLDYSVTLTPTAIRNIKQYNKDAENYLDNSLSCDNSLFCSSKFLSSKLEDLGVTNIFRNNDTFTESRYIKPVGGNS